MKRVALYCNIFWLLLSVFICQQAYRLKLGAVTKPGPGLFPFSLGAVMLFLSLIALFQSVGKKGEDRRAERQERIRWWNIAIILAAILAYAFTLDKVGFLVNTFLFICLLLKVVEPQSWKTTILGGAITAVAADLVFNVAFRAQIPSGILGF